MASRVAEYGECRERPKDDASHEEGSVPGTEIGEPPNQAEKNDRCEAPEDQSRAKGILLQDGERHVHTKPPNAEKVSTGRRGPPQIPRQGSRHSPQGVC